MIYIEIYRASLAQLNYLLSSLILWEARNAFLTFLLSPLWKSIFHDPILMITRHEWLKVEKNINNNNDKDLGCEIHFHRICHLCWTANGACGSRKDVLKDLWDVLKSNHNAILRNLLDVTLFGEYFSLHSCFTLDVACSTCKFISGFI